ncbi:MAG TPA: DNRLRE domain-containing protein, partial [Caldilineae bacterium]|nr:DNRLRE domain-containing protein [Caldilineae bacterium]
MVDTYLMARDPDKAHDLDPVLPISNRTVVLFRFDLSGLPEDADVVSANLALWVDSRSAPVPLDVAAHRLIRAWEDGATWYMAAPGRPWQLAGAKGDLDRGEVLSRQTLSRPGQWYMWDLTPALREWAIRPVGTLHILLAAEGEASVEYYFASSEWDEVKLRPRLTIRYREPKGFISPASLSREVPAYGKSYFPAMPYVVYDWRNRDWQAENPQRGPVGSHIEFTWEDINPAPGRFDWSQFDEYLRVARSQQVTLRDGTIAPKPVMFTLMLAGSGEDGRFQDFTPAWVYEAIEGRPKLNGRPVGYLIQPEGCQPAAVPLYDDPTWQSALAAAIAAFGARYDDDPQVAGIWIGAGLDDETQPAKPVNSCDYPAELAQQLSCEAYMGFLDRLMTWYADAFPHKPLWIQAAPGACVDRSGPWSRRQIMTKAAALGIGYKANALQPDMVTAVGYLNSAGWQKMDTADRYAGKIPIAFEPAFSGPVGEDDPVEYVYWMVHNGLAHHATFIALQSQWLDDLDQIPEIWETMQDSLNRTASNASTVWIVLRDAECEPVVWVNAGNGCEPGDWDFYLYRLEDIPGNGTVHLRESELPPESTEQPYGRHARRTDEA